jgi:alkylation response protein AidB-like acyl-CoA dehydrogenase
MSVPQPKSPLEPGGSFLFQPMGRHPIFTPERFTDEQRMMYQTCFNFTAEKVLPHVEELERKDTDRMVRLIKEAAELGLLSNDVSEKYGGLGGDKVTSMLLSEAVSQYGGWAVTCMAHSGIGTLPIVYFGTPAQKQKYLPKLVTAEWIGAYALTEPGSGSDARAARCRAVPTSDGSAYLLSGTKQFITNAAWADLFIVFAQAETDAGPKFSCFIVERSLPGVSIGPEEHKIGIHGSSTASLILEDVRVPADQLLGEIGKGHKIAFNILNIGRHKLGAGAIGGMKGILQSGLSYAKDRKQFGKSIGEFGAIRKKLARAAAHLYAQESMCYRAAALVDERVATLDTSDPGYDREVIDAVEEYAIEASILKVAGSESLFFVVDEMLQLYGGYGYLEEYAPARLYRDNRINRIFEGTNEVNRMLIPGTILKRALTGGLPLMQAFAEAQGVQSSRGNDEPRQVVDECKRATVLAMGLAVGRYMQSLSDQQEILEALADAIIFCFGLDSVFQRAAQAPAERRDYHLNLATAYAAEAIPRLFQSLEMVVIHVAAPDERAAKLEALRHFDVSQGRYDIIALHDTIAAQLLAEGRYSL